jgi:GT2 family glycosyltransferase
MGYKVGVVILNYRREDLTLRCLQSLSGQRSVILRIVIVDNASDDEEYGRLCEGLRTIQETPDFSCSVVRSRENLGFAKGMNLGIDYLRGLKIGYIFLANSDLVFQDPETLNTLFSASRLLAESPDSCIALMNPLVSDPDGTVQRGISFSRSLTRLHMWKTQFPWIDRVRTVPGSAGRRQEVPNGEKTEQPEKAGMSSAKTENCAKVDERYRVVDCAFVLTPVFFRHYTGLFPGTFLYNEEYTTILLLKSAGLQTMSVTTPPILHLHGASTSAEMKSEPLFQKKIQSGRRAFLRLLITPDALTRRRYDTGSYSK